MKSAYQINSFSFYATAEISTTKRMLSRTCTMNILKQIIIPNIIYIKCQI